MLWCPCSAGGAVFNRAAMHASVPKPWLPPAYSSSSSSGRKRLFFLASSSSSSARL